MSIKTLGLRHVALNVFELEACVQFYVKLLGMKIEWQPDENNIYLTSGHDNLALHRVAKTARDLKSQRLDHIGFILPTAEAVDHAYQFFLEHHVKIIAIPKTHRDGAHSFYCADPDGNVVQMIYHSPLAKLV